MSKDSVKSHRNFKAKLKIPFTLLSDTEGEVCRAYGVLKEKQRFGTRYTGIERSTFLIDEAGKLIEQYRAVNLDGHVQEVLERFSG